MKARLLNVALLTGLLFGGVALKGQFVWTGNGASGALTDANNWGGSAPTGVGTENLTFNTTGNWTTLLVGTSAFNSVTFSGGRPTYTFAGTGPTPVLTVNGNVTLATGNPVVFNNTLGIALASGNRTVDVGPASGLQVDGNITGAGSLVKIGTGVLNLGGVNTYSGGTTISFGTIHVDTGSVTHASTNTVVGNASGDLGQLFVINGGDLTNNIGLLGFGASSTGTATVDGAGSTWTNTVNLVVGSLGTGNLDIINGGSASATGGNVSIGAGAAATGTVTLSGTGSLLQASASVFVGDSGSGHLTVGAGSTVSDATGFVGRLAGNTSDATIDGGTWTNSTYLYVGAGTATATLHIANGGLVSAPFASFGNNTSSTGDVYVNGLGSTLAVADTLYVGSQGVGYLEITNGAHVTSVTGSVGNNAGGQGSVSVDGSGSLWNNSGSLLIGNATNGYLFLDHQGAVTGANASFGTLTGVSSTVSMSNGSTLGTSGNLVLGDAGSGYFLADAGAVITTGGQGILGNSAGSSGLFGLSGAASRWNLTGDLTIGNSGSGILYVTNSATLNVGGGTGIIHLAQNASSTGNMYLGYDGESYSAGAIINAAAITTGAGSGSLTIAPSSTRAAPYYLTRDGTSTGTSVLITGPTQVQAVSGYVVLAGANTYTGGTLIGNGATVVAGSNTALGTGAVTFGTGQLSLASGVALSNPLALASGATLGGNGTFASAVAAGTGITLAPGFSVGTMSFSSGLSLAAGGTYDLEVQAAGGVAGTGFDLINVSGAALDVAATSGSPFTLRVISLNLAGVPGNVSDFSSSTSYSWIIASSTSGITNFAANKFALNTTGFTNSLGIGSFFVTQSGNNLVLNFTAVPEPSTYALLIAGLASVFVSVRRRNRIAP